MELAQGSFMYIDIFILAAVGVGGIRLQRWVMRHRRGLVASAGKYPNQESL